MSSEIKVYDFVFVGMGASNSLILLSLIKNGLTPDKKIAVLELDSKTKNDKTYCFWADLDEPIVSELSSIISYKFNHIRVNGSHVDSIENRPYHYIRSIDLYNSTFELIKKSQIDFYQALVTTVSVESEIYTLHTPAEKYHAKYVFDSRPPVIDIRLENDIYLHQSFYGWHIKCENDVFDKHTFDMMNFQIEQDQFTQFVYVIPFSSNEALVELTRFGAEKIEFSYATKLLANFISTEFGSYEIIGDEVGCIPMSTFKNPVNHFEGILNTGASANLIKPSTGYGFKNMFYFSKLVTEHVASTNLKDFNTIKIKSKARFKFYDHLLLLILFHWPSLGKKIFSRLFNKVPVLTIFSFLEERTSLLEEIRIFISLPIKPFLKALLLYLKNKNGLRYIIALVAFITYALLSLFDLQIAQYFNYLLLVIGLLWIGIPHGALDHKLSTDKKTSLPLFIFNYLLIIGAYLIFWYFFPVISLLIFIAYSSFHFGESELIQNQEQVNSFKNYLKAFLLGLSILIFIITTHWQESITIISNIDKGAKLTPFLLNFKPFSTLASVASLIYIFLHYLTSKSFTFLGVLFLLLLGIQAPLSMAFGLYFIIQHSSNAWTHLKKGLNLSSRVLYLKSFPFTLGALLIFCLMAYFLSSSIDQAGIWAIFFVFIACISLPHFIMMHLFYASKSK
jgi:lycopene beta-cyclase